MIEMNGSSIEVRPVSVPVASKLECGSALCIAATANKSFYLNVGNWCRRCTCYVDLDERDHRNDVASFVLCIVRS